MRATDRTRPRWNPCTHLEGCGDDHAAARTSHRDPSRDPISPLPPRGGPTFLGFGPYFDEPFYVGFEVAGYELGLLPDGAPDDGALTYWGVADVAAAVEDALALGASVHVAASEVGDGIITATVRTPDGTIVGFIDNPHFGGV